MNKVIINADDFGYSHIVNQEIISCINNGIVTSTTLMANGPALKEAVDFALANRKASFGVHLVLDEGKPLVPSSVFVKYGIVDNNGYFVRGAIYRIVITKDIENAVYKEWCAQVERLLNMGLNISHIDSHHHVHTIKGLYHVLKRVCSKYRIEKVRLSLWASPFTKLREKKLELEIRNNKTTPYSKRSFMKVVYDYIANMFLYYNLKSRFITADFFCAYMYYAQNKNVINLHKSDVIEIMCHPGHPSFQKELDLLKKESWNAFVKINYLNI